MPEKEAKETITLRLGHMNVKATRPNDAGVHQRQTFVVEKGDCIVWDRRRTNPLLTCV